MLTREQLIQRWKSWMNRNRSFTKPEMEELENHLWEEMDEMVASEGYTEEEAFTKAVVNMGSSDHVYPEFEQNHPFLNKAENWIHQKSIPIIITLALLVAFLFADSIYVNHHSFKVYQNKIWNDKGVIKLKKLSLEDSFNQKELISFETKPFDKEGSAIFYHAFYWFKDSAYIETIPVYVGNVYTANEVNFIFVLDNHNNLWIDQDGSFNYNSKKIQNLNPVSYRFMGIENEDCQADRSMFVLYQICPGKDPNDGIVDDIWKYLPDSEENLILKKNHYAQNYFTVRWSDNDILKFYLYDLESDWFKLPIPEEHSKEYKVIGKSTFSVRVSDYQICRITYYLDINTQEPFLYFEEGIEVEKPLHIIQYLINQIMGKDPYDNVF